MTPRYDEEFCVSNDADGRLVLRMEPHVAEALADLLEHWNEDLIARGVNRDSGWADVATQIRERNV